MSNNYIVKQLVDGIVPESIDKDLPPEEKKRIEEQRKALTGRAWEYLMFMDD